MLENLGSYCAPAWGAPAPHSPWPRHGGHPPPIPPGPARPASCPACPPSPVRAGLLRPPAMTRCCTRPGSAALGRPASPGLRPSLVPVRPAKSRCSWGPGRTDRGRTGLQRGGLQRPIPPGPGRTVLQHGGLPPPRHPGSGPGPKRARPPASRRCSRPPGRTLPAPAGSAHTDRVRTGPARTGLRFPRRADRSDRVRTPPGRPGRIRAGPSWRSRNSRAGPDRAGPGPAGRTGRTRSTRTRPGRPRGVPIRTTPGAAPAAATARPTAPALNSGAPAGPPAVGRGRTDRRRRAGRDRSASVPRQEPRPTGHRSATAARTGGSRAGRRPGPTGPFGRAVEAAAGRRRRRAARLPSGRYPRRNCGIPRGAGRVGASGRRCGEPAARSTSWSPPPSRGRDWAPAAGGDRWPGPARPAAPARAAALGGRSPGTASSPPAWSTGGSPRSRRAVPGEAILVGIPAAACRGPGGYGAGRAACRPAGAGRWCGLGSRDRPGRRRRPGWGQAGNPAGSHRRRRLRRPSHAPHGQTRRPDDSPATSRPRACSPRAVSSSPPPADVAALAFQSSVGRAARRGMADGQLA